MSLTMLPPLFPLCRIGNEAELAPVATGSHIDAIPYSGKYDGVVGVLGAIEAINVLKRYWLILLVASDESEICGYKLPLIFAFWVD